MLFPVFPRLVVYLFFLLSVVSFTEELSLYQALNLGLQNSFDLLIEEKNVSIARERLEKLKAVNATAMKIDYQRRSKEKLQNSIDFSSNTGIRNWEEHNWSATMGFEGRSIHGTSYSLDYDINYMDNSLNRRAPSLSALFNPEVETFLGVKVNQPLLKNAGRAVNFAPRRIGVIEVKISDFRQQILLHNKVLEIINSYYDLLFAQENLDSRKKALVVAERFVELAERRMQAGQADRSDVDQARIRAHEAEEKILLARDFYRRVHNGLLRQLLGSVQKDTEIPEFMPSSQEFSITLPIREREFYIDAALKNRPDYQAAEHELQQSRLRLDYAAHQVLPELNLSFSYGYWGLGAGHDKSWNMLNEWEEPELAVGLAYRIPLGGSVEERAEQRMREHQSAQSALSLEKISTNIVLEVSDALKRIELMNERALSVQKTRELAESTLQAEEKRYLNGRTSSFQVLELQDRLSNAVTREISAKVDLKKAVEELWSVTGLLLSKNNLHLQEKK
jgi:outer membrane protein TolC